MDMIIKYIIGDEEFLQDENTVSLSLFCGGKQETYEFTPPKSGAFKGINGEDFSCIGNVKSFQYDLTPTELIKFFQLNPKIKLLRCVTNPDLVVSYNGFPNKLTDYWNREVKGDYVVYTAKNKMPDVKWELIGLEDVLKPKGRYEKAKTATKEELLKMDRKEAELKLNLHKIGKKVEKELNEGFEKSLTQQLQGLGLHKQPKEGDTREYIYPGFDRQTQIYINGEWVLESAHKAKLEKEKEVFRNFDVKKEDIDRAQADKYFETPGGVKINEGKLSDFKNYIISITVPNRIHAISKILAADSHEEVLSIYLGEDDGKSKGDKKYPLETSPLVGDTIETPAGWFEFCPDGRWKLDTYKCKDISNLDTNLVFEWLDKLNPNTIPKNPSAKKVFESSYKEIGEKDYFKSETGVKHSEGKLPLDAMLSKQFPKALKAVCEATLFGHNKYLEHDADYLNFKRVKGGSQAYADALQRHNLDKSAKDLESGLPHIYHKAWNALAELELWIEEN